MTTIRCQVQQIRTRPDAVREFRTLAQMRQWYESAISPFLLSRAAALMDFLTDMGAEIPVAVIQGETIGLSWVRVNTSGLYAIADLSLTAPGFCASFAIQLQAGIPIYRSQQFECQTLAPMLPLIHAAGAPSALPNVPMQVAGYPPVNVLITLPFMGAPTVEMVQAQAQQAKAQGQEAIRLGEFQLEDLPRDSDLFTAGVANIPAEWRN